MLFNSTSSIKLPLLELYTSSQWLLKGRFCFIKNFATSSNRVKICLLFIVCACNLLSRVLPLLRVISNTFHSLKALWWSDLFLYLDSEWPFFINIWEIIFQMSPLVDENWLFWNCLLSLTDCGCHVILECGLYLYGVIPPLSAIAFMVWWCHSTIPLYPACRLLYSIFECSIF